MGRYGMAGDHYRQSGYVTLQDVPDPNREYVESFANLTGGMNRFDLDFQLKGNESTFVQNLSWHNGALNSRWGQVEIGALNGMVIAAAPFLFHGWLIAHCRNRYVWFKVQQTGEAWDEEPVGTRYSSVGLASIPETAGTFFRYREDVFYKAKGAFHRFYWNHRTDQIDVGSAITRAYVPVIQINTKPESGAGDLFQSENRLTDAKKVLYDVTAANTTAFHLPVTEVSMIGLQAYIGEDIASRVWYELDLSQMNISADGKTLIDGVVVLQTAPPVDSEVTIFYRKENPGAYKSIMDCSVAAVFGGAQELCVVFAGCEAQPNAYFWSGINGLVMDQTYFPMEQYNLVGDNDDPITAMGKQQNMLVIFQGGSTGRAVFGTEKINDLERITMNYTRINAEIGCDLPGSLQLVENNLVWCNRRYGVCRLKGSSAAYENNITIISRKINGDTRVPGLLKELTAVKTGSVQSTDTGRKYFLMLGRDAYEWNYELSGYENPSWFFHRGIQGIGFIPEANDVLYEVLPSGKVAQFSPVFADFGEPIEKIYEFPPRNFGSYDRLKNIKSVLFETRGDASTNTQVTYKVDYRSRVDPTNLVSHAWNLVPRNLRFRDLAVVPFASVFRRKPGYHNIRHLKMTLYNNEAGIDLSIVSAQIFYEFRGRQR